jgi:hypothetical protein
VNREREAPLDAAIALERDSSAHAIFRSASVALPGPRGCTSGASSHAPTSPQGTARLASPTSTTHRTTTIKETK